MPTTRPLVLIMAAVVAALAAGSAYAFIGPGGDTPAPSHARPFQQQEPDDEDVEAQEDDDEADEANAAGGAPDKAALIADAFGVSEDDVLDLRDEGIGWGAIFKLYQLAQAQGVDVDTLVAAAATDAEGERGFAFGEMMNSLTDEERAALDDGPRNFGHLVSKPKKPAHAGQP